MTGLSFNVEHLVLELHHCWNHQAELQQAILPPSALQIHYFPTLPSTNQTLWEFITAGASAGTVVIAGAQQSGKGQWGRQWQSSPGGLYLSCALAPNLPADCAAQLTQAIAWGIASTLHCYQVPVRLKWPNDLVLERRKLGGILIETRMMQGRIRQAVVGVGINWQNPVPEPGLSLHAYLMSQGLRTIAMLETLAALTLGGIVLGATVLQTQSIETRLKNYLQLLINLGQTIAVADQVGTIVGVSPTGELLVRLGTGPSPAYPDEQDLTPLISLKPGTISLGYR